MNVATIDRPAVLRVLEQNVPACRGYPAGKLWHARTVTANRVRGRIEAVLTYAKARGHRTTEDNPADLAVLEHVLGSPTKLAPREHLAALPYAEVPAAIAALRQRQGVAVQALQFLILTAARTAETLGMTWDEVDLDTKTWTIPALRMKGGREHRVPLSDPAIALLKNAHREDGNNYVWIGVSQARLSATALAKALAPIRSGVTVHGFRSSFSDWAHERTTFSAHVVELSLAHTIGNGVEQAYRRTDLFEKRRRLMQAWAAHCTTSAPTLHTVAVPMLRATSKAPA
jgi:integrase